MEDFSHRWGLVDEPQNKLLFREAQFRKGALVGLLVDLVDLSQGPAAVLENRFSSADGRVAALRRWVAQWLVMSMFWIRRAILLEGIMLICLGGAVFALSAVVARASARTLRVSTLVNSHHLRTASW